MNPQETQMLQDFLDQLVKARGIQKDQEADAMIQRAVAQQPDAAYLLVQRALLVGQALDNAKARIATLEDQLRQAQSGQRGGNGRFLDADAWGNSGTARPAAQAPAQSPAQSPAYAREAQPQYQPQYEPQYQPQYQQPQRGGFLSGGFGSTLGSIATTAAGVAAGGFLFHGLENMFNHNEGSGGSQHLLNSEDKGNNLFSDQSGSSLADQAGVGDVDSALSSDNSRGEGLFDSNAENGIDGGGFFDGDGSDEGLFS
nr:DUF2076 domain-containing protein [uncultured Massilia sp.]